MNEDFVPFELARELKEKGFPQRVFGTYEMYGAAYFNDGRLYRDGCICHIDEAYTAPTISQVLKWLREKKKIYVTVNVEREDWFEYKIVQLIKDTRCTGNHVYETYDDAILAGIEYVINNLI